MKAPVSRSNLRANIEPTALTHRSDTNVAQAGAFSINCLLRTVRIEESVCLLSRINYCFPTTLTASVSLAMQRAHRLNQLMSQSKVHVVEDIDGSHGYFLQLDSILQGDANRQQISVFLAGVTQDIEAMLKYFQIEACSPESLSTVSKNCNIADLQTPVCIVS